MSTHKKTQIDSDLPYEENVIGMKGIVYFGVGLFLLIVITFGLMWFFQNKVLLPEFKKISKKNRMPMAMSKKDMVPKNIQLQSARGFGIVDPQTGERINLALREPQAEYRELIKIWEKQWENGEKVINPTTKEETVVSMPIKEAKEKFLNSEIKAKSGAEGEEALNEATSMLSAASSGRTRTVIRR